MEVGEFVNRNTKKRKRDIGPYIETFEMRIRYENPGSRDAKDCYDSYGSIVPRKGDTIWAIGDGHGKLSLTSGFHTIGAASLDGAPLAEQHAFAGVVQSITKNIGVIATDGPTEIYNWSGMHIPTQTAIYGYFDTAQRAVGVTSPQEGGDTQGRRAMIMPIFDLEDRMSSCVKLWSKADISAAIAQLAVHSLKAEPTLLKLLKDVIALDDATPTPPIDFDTVSAIIHALKTSTRLDIGNAVQGDAPLYGAALRFLRNIAKNHPDPEVRDFADLERIEYASGERSRILKRHYIGLSVSHASPDEWFMVHVRG